MKKYILTWILLLGCFSIAFAQKNMSEIKGVVLDENKEPLIGVNTVSYTHLTLPTKLEV